MPFFTVSIPMAGQCIIRLEAETKEQALAIVRAEGYEIPDEDDEEDESHHGMGKFIGYKNSEASLLMEGPVREMFVQAMGDDDNHN